MYNKYCVIYMRMVFGQSCLQLTGLYCWRHAGHAAIRFRTEVGFVSCCLLFQSTASLVIHLGCSAVTQCQITLQEKLSLRSLASSSLLLQVRFAHISSLFNPELCTVYGTFYLPFKVNCQHSSPPFNSCSYIRNVKIHFVMYSWLCTFVCACV